MPLSRHSPSSAGAGRAERRVLERQPVGEGAHQFARRAFLAGRLRPIRAPRGAPSTQPIWPDASHSQRNRFGPATGSRPWLRAARRLAPPRRPAARLRACSSAVRSAPPSRRSRARLRRLAARAVRRRFRLRSRCLRRPARLAANGADEGRDFGARALPAPWPSRPRRAARRPAAARRPPACRRRRWRSAAARRRGRRCCGRSRRGSAWATDLHAGADHGQRGIEQGRIDFVMRAGQQVDQLAPADGPVVRIRDRLGHHRPQAVVETHLLHIPRRACLRTSLAGSRVRATGGAG